MRTAMIVALLEMQRLHGDPEARATPTWRGP